MTDRIYILLPVHNRREITRRFIECLKLQTYSNYHLLLIDDGSTDGTDDMVRSAIESTTVIKGQGSWWWAGSLQQGFLWIKAHAQSPDDIVLIMNDDTEFDSNFLEKGRDLLLKNKKTLLLAYCYSRQNGRLIDAGGYIDWPYISYKQAYKPQQIRCLSTRGLFMRAADYLHIGGFYPRLLSHYGSDNEFTIRARRKGMQLMTDKTLMLQVDEGATGCHTVVAESLLEYLRKCFSLRALPNPGAQTLFVILACPWRWKILALAILWKDFFLHALYYGYHDIRRLVRTSRN